MTTENMNAIITTEETPEQLTVQSIGQTEEKPVASRAAKGKKAKKNEGIPKVQAEIVTSAHFVEKDKIKADEAAALEALGQQRKSLDVLTMNIRKQVDAVSKSFCRIGFYLWKVRETEMYKAGGYKNVYEYGKAMFNFQRSSVANYISVCERFSIPTKEGKPSEKLREGFGSYSYTQLVQCLALPETELEKVNPEMSAKQIRELKASVVTGVESGSVADAEETVSPLHDCPALDRTEYSDQQRVFGRVLTEDNLKILCKYLEHYIGKKVDVFAFYA